MNRNPNFRLKKLLLQTCRLNHITEIKHLQLESNVKIQKTDRRRISRRCFALVALKRSKTVGIEFKVYLIQDSGHECFGLLVEVVRI